MLLISKKSLLRENLKIYLKNKSLINETTMIEMMKNSFLENGKCRNRKKKLELVKKEAELKASWILLSQNCNYALRNGCLWFQNTV